MSIGKQFTIVRSFFNPENMMEYDISKKFFSWVNENVSYRSTLSADSE